MTIISLKDYIKLWFCNLKPTVMFEKQTEFTSVRQKVA